MRKKALLWEKLEKNRVHCLLCAHNCKINQSTFGVCGIRQNVNGELFTYAYGKTIANNTDPIEKKPLYHFLPGSSAYSIATTGCNFHCSFCQNWTISQISAKNKEMGGIVMSPENIVKEAIRNNCRSISYTYTEPTVFFEYAYDTARSAKENGLFNTFVTNGYMTKEAIDMIRPFLDAANVDLKFFKDASYSKICGGKLQPVLDSIRHMKESGIWVEVTTLVVPGKNDSDEELGNIAGFIAGTSKDIPWHISRFHPDYKLADLAPTPVDTMKKAYDTGKEAGLKYVYLGNVPTDGETVCPDCGVLLVSREGFSGGPTADLRKDGKCGKCEAIIAGVWS